VSAKHTKALAAALAGLTPDQQRQREMIVALCDNMREHALAFLPQLPPAWDGHELRELLADLFDMERTHLMQQAKRSHNRRYKVYRNFVICNL